MSSKPELDDLFSSDEEAEPTPHGRFSTETLHRAYDSRATPRPKPAAQTQLSARAPPAPPTRAAARAAQIRSRAVTAQQVPTTRRFDFLAPPSEGGLLVEANATGQAALDEAACFDAACGGSSLAEHMTSLLQVMPPNTGAGGLQGAAVDAALEARAAQTRRPPTRALLRSTHFIRTRPVARRLRRSRSASASSTRRRGCSARSRPSAPTSAAGCSGSRPSLWRRRSCSPTTSARRCARPAAHGPPPHVHACRASVLSPE